MIKTITKEQIKAKIERAEDFKILDVRDTPDYLQGHLPGAIHLLIADMDAEKASALFQPDDEIVVYSLNIDCPAKFIAAQKLMDLGFKNVVAYPGSWMDWKDAGYPIEGGAS